MAVQVLTVLITYRTPPSANWMRVSAVSVTSCVRPTVGTSPDAVGAGGSSGGGAVTPLVGISPASVETDRHTSNVIADRSRFMVCSCSPLRI